MTFPSAFQCYIPRDKKVYGCICISHNDTVLLVKGRRSHKWSFPKGHMKPSDRTNLDCALRELNEETGISLCQDPISYKKYTAAGYYIFDFDKEFYAFPADKTEIEEVKWVHMDEISTLIKNVDLSMFCNHMNRIGLSVDISRNDSMPQSMP